MSSCEAPSTPGNPSAERKPTPEVLLHFLCLSWGAPEVSTEPPPCSSWPASQLVSFWRQTAPVGQRPLVPQRVQEPRSRRRWTEQWFTSRVANSRTAQDFMALLRGRAMENLQIVCFWNFQSAADRRSPKPWKAKPRIIGLLHAIVLSIPVKAHRAG